MIAEPVELPWGRGEVLPIRIPSAWQVVAQSDPKPPASIVDLDGAIQERLDGPIDSAPLRDLVGPGTRIALVMDDTGRPTPVDRLAPVVLDYLLAAGAKRGNIIGLFSIGTHAVMSPEEMATRAGPAVTARIACHSVDCHDEEAFTNLGQTKRGTPVLLNRFAAAADLRILIGTIEPHPQAGYGGGFKNLVPGLAAAETIGHNHLLLPSPERYNMIGTRPEDNPMRLDLEEACHMVDGPTFILNVVLDPQLEPVAVVAGDAVAAHRAGVELSRSIYGIALPRPVDIVISSAYPMDQSLRQAGKGILNVAGACRPGGVIIGFLRCQQGLSDLNLPRFGLPLAPVRTLVKALGSRGIAFLANHLPRSVAVEDRFLVNLGLQMLKDYHVLIFSPRLVEDAQGRLPPVVYDNQEVLFGRASRLARRPDPEVAIFYQGGVCFPVFGRP